jgi:hypothetical protein
MGVHEGRGTLGKALKTLENRWLEAKFNWNDQQTREFEERFMVPLQMELRSAVGAMDTVASLVSRIHSECE